jgi:hypothetical protein
MGALWLAWLVMDELKFDDRQRFTACIFMAAFPGLIWMSQDARYYALITFAGVATIYLALRHHWTFGIVFGLLYFIHPTAPAYGLAAFVIAWLRKMGRRNMFAAVCATIFTHSAMIILIRYVKSFPFTAGYCCSGGKQAWFLDTFTFQYSAYSIVQAFFVNTLPPMLMIAALAWIGYTLARILLRPMAIPALMVIIPLSAVIVVSVFYQNVFYYRPLMGLMIPLSLWIGYARERIVTYVGLALLLIGVARYDPAARGAYVDLSAARIRAEWQAGDRITYTDGLSAAPFDYYLSDLPSCVLSLDYLPTASSLTVCATEAAGREWLITSSSWYETPHRRTDAILFDELWPWQVTPIQIYIVEKQ